MYVLDTNIKEELKIQPERKIKSFVCRNRRLTPGQQELLDKYYCTFGLSDNLASWDFDKIFNNKQKVILEIGFGTGDSLLNNCTTNPDFNYIGIEVYRAGIINILDYIKQSEQEPNNNTTNLRVCAGDAKLIIENSIANKSLHGVQIFFPDPWPKSKHHKRRLIQTDFINMLAQKIESTGFLHMATDWQPYADHIKKIMAADNINDKFKDIEYSNYNVANKHNRPLTKFEQKGINKGHNISDLVYSVV